jgi:hypothetical protein
MNGAHLHLVINHLPVLGTLFGVGLALYALVRREDAILKAALGIFLLVGVSGYAASWSGEEAEDVLEEAVPTVSHDVIHEHEEMAEKAAIGGYVLGVLSLLTLGLSWGKPVRKPFAIATLAAAFVVGGLMVYTANLGGEIRHTEIEGVAASGAEPGVLPSRVERRGDQ